MDPEKLQRLLEQIQSDTSELTPEQQAESRAVVDVDPVAARMVIQLILQNSFKPGWDMAFMFLSQLYLTHMIIREAYSDDKFATYAAGQVIDFMLTGGEIPETPEPSKK